MSSETTVHPLGREPDDGGWWRVVEAVLFASPTPVPEAELAQRLPAGTDLAGMLDRLVAHYRPRGINLVRVGGGWTFRTAVDLAGRLALSTGETRRLTRAQLETLAIIAYHEADGKPVTRGEIEEIRGVQVQRGTLDLLIEAGWIRPGPRREVAGRPATWLTTPAFLAHFSLSALRDLPTLREMKELGLLDARPMAVLGEGAPETEPEG